MSRLGKKLQLLDLEPRAVPAVWNNPWADAGNITVSFAPESTVVDGVGSSLFNELSNIGDPAVWQREMMRAFQTWAAAANLNFSVVADDGGDFGSGSVLQGSSRHGDIRVAARPLSAGQLAVSTPFDLFDTWSGEIILNAAHAFNRGGTDGGYDLYTVMLQEVGHALGLPNSEDPASAMYTLYQGPRSSLSPADVAAVQVLYGVRAADRFDAGSGNNVRSNAKELKFTAAATQLAGTDGTAGTVPHVALGDLTALTDVDFYKVKVPTGHTSFTVVLRGAGVSSLTANVKVLDSAGKFLAGAAAVDPHSGDVTVTLTGAKAGSTYVIQVDGAAEDGFGIGAYRLAVGKEANLAVYPPTPTGFINQDGTYEVVDLGVQKESPDSGSGSGSGSGTGGGSGSGSGSGYRKATTDLRWDAVRKASVHAGNDNDLFKIRTLPDNRGALVVSVWALAEDTLDPALAVYNSYGVALPVHRLADESGRVALQVSGTLPNHTYYIRVSAADPAGDRNVGNYFLGVDFRDHAFDTEDTASGTLSAKAPQAASDLVLAEEQMFRFSLTAQGAGTEGVRMSVYDLAGSLAFTMLATAGQTSHGNVMLGAGTYTVVYSGGTQDGSGLGSLNYSMKAWARSDPMGIKPVNPAPTPGGGTSNPTPPPTVAEPPPPPKWLNPRVYLGPYTSPYSPL